jgi:holliday junction DNA helicase RuvB
MITTARTPTIGPLSIDSLDDDLLSPSRSAAPVERMVPFSDVVGQRRAVELLKRFVDGTSYGFGPPALCLIGPSGRGKTMLATELATAVGLPCVSVECGRDISPTVLINMITDHADSSLFFLDEIQSLPRRSQEVLFSAIDRAQVPRVKRGCIDRIGRPVNIESHLWVGATNLPGKLLSALRTRMLPVQLEPYTVADLEVMATRISEKHDAVLEASAIARVAQASGGSPRLLTQILQTIAMTTLADRYEARHAGEDYVIRQDTAEEILTLMGIDRFGLDPIERLLIVTIQSQPRKSASAELLAHAAGLDTAFTRERLVHLRWRRLVSATTGLGWSLTSAGDEIAAALE